LQFHSDLKCIRCAPHVCDTADVQAILPFPANPLKHVLCDVPDGSSGYRTIPNVTFTVCVCVIDTNFTICDTSYSSYGVTKSSDNLYTPCTFRSYHPVLLFATITGSNYNIYYNQRDRVARVRLLFFFTFAVLR